MGEDSKRSGEIGEALTKAFLERTGWKTYLKTVTIKCNSTEHKTESGNDRLTHGDDLVAITHSPFYDQRTDVIHISSKNNLHGYSERESDLKREFKSHLKELNEIINCAKYDSNLLAMLENFKPRRNTEHIGLLVWTSSDNSSANDNIVKIIANSRLSEELNNNIFVIDGAKINFIYTVINHIENEVALSNIDSYDYYCPDPGGLLYKEEERHKINLPIELMISEVIPIRGQSKEKDKLYLYANQSFDVDSYKRLLDLALGFANAWPNEIYIGFIDYNEAHHSNDAASAELSYATRDKKFKPFCFKNSHLNELQK